MLICIVIYLAGFGFLLLFRRRKIPPFCKTKEGKRMIAIIFLANTIALCLFVQDGQKAGRADRIYRNAYGKGDKRETYKVTIEDGVQDEEITVEVGEREYTNEEIRNIFKKCMDLLDKKVLANNESFDHVEEDLNLVSSLEEYPVGIQWNIEKNDVLDIFGAVHEYNTKEEGTLVEIKGVLSYREEQAMYVRTAIVYPRSRNAKEKLVEQVSNWIEEKERTTRQEESFQLPSNLYGHEIQWKKEIQPRGYYVLVLGIVGAVLMLALKKQNEKEEEKARKEQLFRDYPEMISKFTLLLSTGMNVRNVWERIVEDYEAQKEVFGKRIVYEEMRYTCNEMNGGIPENEAYERFGRRCGTSMYVKFGALLSQNLRKGTQGLSQILDLEALQAFENRKNHAKRLGEEAGTKLLLPMFAMLGVVLVIIIIPAFLSMQI